MRLATSAIWLAIAQASRVTTQLASVAVLTRLLSPAEFGLMAMASAVIAFGTMLRDMGTGAAIVQIEELAETLKNTVFWINVGFGIALAALLVAGSPLLAMAFRAEDLTWILVCLAPVFVLSGATTVHQALLERESSFATLARIEVTSAVTGLATAVTAAFCGAGVYSLVLQSLVTTALSSLQLRFASGFRPSGRASLSEARVLLGFSGNLASFNLVNYLTRSADTLIVGRWLGAAQLGTYSAAYKLMLFPLQNLTFVAARALFPVMSRQQNQLSDMTALYLRTVRLIAAITAPLTLGMLAVRVPLVEVLFGPKWRGAADVLMWLAPTGFLQSITSTTGSVLKARGRTDVMFRLGALGAVVQVSAFLIGARTGVNAVAAWYFAANLLLSPIALFFTMQQLDGPFSRIVSSWLPAFASALLMAALTSVADRGLSEIGLNAAPRLAGGVLFGALAYAVALRFIDPGSVEELLALLRRGRQDRAARAAARRAPPAHGLTSPQQQRTISEQSD